MKYILIDSVGTDEFISEFDDKVAAIEEAKKEWSFLTDHDKGCRDRFYVLESANPDENADDHFDGNPVYTIKDFDFITVEYSGGESRKNAGVAVDYMMAKINGVEVYAEAPAPSEDEDEDANYEDLKDAIIDQADDLGYHRDMLRFWHD